MQAAGEAHVAGRLAEALELARNVLEAEPNHIQAHLLMGVLAGKTGRNELALEHLNFVANAEPDRIEALFWLSIVHRRTKEYSKATELAERAVRLRREDAHLQNNLGLCYLDQSRLEEAVEAFQRSAALRPDFAPIHHNLGTAHYMLGRDLAAASAFDRALAIAPRSVDSLLSLGQTMISMTNPSQAVACARKALAIDPNSASGRLLLASALAEEGRTAESEVEVRKAISLKSDDAKSHALLGLRLQSVGRFDEANEHLRRSMALEPRQGFAYFAFVHNNRVTEADRPMLDHMQSLVAAAVLPPREEAFLFYGLGRAQEMLGDYAEAIQNFDEANRLSRQLKFGNSKFDREDYRASYDELIRTFSPDTMKGLAGRGNPSDLPVIIVGMMRSGTTLAEQILSSHPQIGAAGEQRFWPISRSAVFGGGARFDLAVLDRKAAQYIEALKLMAPGRPHVTDKMPVNFEILGPLHIGLPNARIIHMRRHPVDTCISIYTTPNRVPITYAYDRDNIVFAYEQYARLMEHWRAVLPPERFLEVRYEDLVEDREREARRMLEFLRLPWSDALLHHEKTERSVLTPSLWQVRQPIYRSSLERWRRYEPWLGAFARLLPAEC
jgi:tetratricopeptide (TPR) repeat protein